MRGYAYAAHVVLFFFLIDTRLFWFILPPPISKCKICNGRKSCSMVAPLLCILPDNKLPMMFHRSSGRKGSSVGPPPPASDSSSGNDSQPEDETPPSAPSTQASNAAGEAPPAKAEATTTPKKKSSKCTVL